RVSAQPSATARREGELSSAPPDAEKAAVRMIHGTGNAALAEALRIHPALVSSARSALQPGAPILADAHMVASGVTRSRLPADNDVVRSLNDEHIPALARELP